jgi:dCMP deaminase
MYMEMAETAAKISYARRLKVGAIATKHGRILSIGINGTPPGTDNECEDVLEDGSLKTNKHVIHAEMNLIYKLARDGESGKGGELFITHSPCYECSKAILSVGFNKVFYRNSYRDPSGIELLEGHGVEVEQI